MRWWGKGLGATFGWAAGGPWGAAIGLLLGNSADAVAPDPRRWRDLKVAASLAGWYPALFAVLGHVARADGRVSRGDVRFARSLMARLRLSGRQRNVAVRAYNDGRDPAFRPEPSLLRLRSVAGDDKGLAEGFLAVLISAAAVDATPGARALFLLRRCAILLGVPAQRLEALLGASGADRKSGDRAAAYRTLGLSAAATDREVKLAYRRLMHRHHPDRLGTAASASLHAAAARRTAEIRRAWEVIRSHRNIR